MKKKGKEVSDRVVIILLIIAVVVSVFGTYLVYDKSNEISSEGMIVQNIQREQPPVGTVGLVVVNPNEEEGGDFNEENR